MNGIFQVKNRRLFLVIYLIILIAWLAFIFGNSLADGERSSQQSGMVVAFIQSIVDVFDSSVTVDPVLVRNLAHYLEFFVLGALYCIGTFFIKAGRVSLWLHSIALSLFTAFTDETVDIKFTTDSFRHLVCQIISARFDFGNSRFTNTKLFAEFVKR